MSYDCRKTHFIDIFGCDSVYRCTVEILMEHYFQGEIANDSAVSRVFTVSFVLIWGITTKGEMNVVFCSIFVFGSQDLP